MPSCGWSQYGVPLTSKRTRAPLDLAVDTTRSIWARTPGAREPGLGWSAPQSTSARNHDAPAALSVLIEVCHQVPGKRTAERFVPRAGSGPVEATPAAALAGVVDVVVVEEVVLAAGVEPE